MSVKNQLLEDMKQAMRDRDSLKLNTIRFALSELKKAEIDQGELSDEMAQKIIARLVKQFSEPLTEYEQAGRSELVDEEKAKIACLESYLPTQLTDEELLALIGKVREENPDLSQGQLIGAVTKQSGGRADGRRVLALLS